LVDRAQLIEARSSTPPIGIGYVLRSFVGAPCRFGSETWWAVEPTLGVVLRGVESNRWCPGADSGEAEGGHMRDREADFLVTDDR
jgi:hypothetical protein